MISQAGLRDAIGSVGELLDALGLDDGALPAASAAAARDFPLRVPRSFVARMRPGDPRDPLLLQVLPTAAELEAVPGYTVDPLLEAAVSPAPGVLHKYRGRALLVVTGACGVHCRYCFRRHFPYAEHVAWSGIERALDWVASERSVEEVILSGGDPLTLPDDRLASLVEGIAGIRHVRRLRIHTRMPVVLPSRVDDALIAWLSATGGGSRLATVVVLHANHASEIDDDVRRAARRLRDAGATLLNQTVLLAGVNDHAATLVALSHTLFDAGVLPYYLHLLDRVAGAAHFEVEERRARELMREVMAALPGYLVPRLVREVPGAPYKVPVDLGA